MMEMELVSEMFELINHLTRLSARECFTDVHLGVAVLFRFHSEEERNNR